MKTYLDCYPCILKQALDAARRINADENTQHQIMLKALDSLKNIKPEATPPELAYKIHQNVNEISGIKDPFKEAKIKSTNEALDLYNMLERLVDNSEDPLLTAIRISIAGNIIDLGVANEYDDLTETVKRVLKQDFAIDHYKQFVNQLNKSEFVLFLADNAGETVFDKILINTLNKPVFYAVKGAPILNDATEEDAIMAGIDSCATVVSSGSAAPGTILPTCSKEFLNIFNSAPIIIAKGQANYECLSESDRPIFCLLQAKCPVIASDANVDLYSIILYKSNCCT